MKILEAVDDACQESQAQQNSQSMPTIPPISNPDINYTYPCSQPLFSSSGHQGNDSVY